VTIEPRSNYKGVWSRLSETYKSATIHVIGDVEEDHILATATHTRSLLEQTVGIRPDDTILEIGCGIGRVGEALAPLCKEWIGCDVSPHMLEHTRQRLAGFNNIRLVEISGFDLAPIPDASVDLVYCTVVFMHIDEWDRYKYVLEAGRVLKPGGRIFIDNFNLRSEEGWDLFEINRRSIPPAYRPPHMAKSSTPQEIEVYLQHAGFHDIHMDEDGIWVRGYGWKPTDGSMDAILEREVLAPPLQPEPYLTSVAAEQNGTSGAQRTIELMQRVEELEKIVAAKNNHITKLESLITRFENGRIMRLLRLLKN
jgi:ubiquinone/menaquinone biosynthesis C-methylase UbiE